MNDVCVPGVVGSDKIRNSRESRLNRECVVNIFQCAIIVKGDPSIFPDINFRSRSNFPVEERLERLGAIKDTSPDPGGVLNVLWFKGARGREVLVFEGIKNRRGCSCEYITAVFC